MALQVQIPTHEAETIARAWRGTTDICSRLFSENLSAGRETAVVNARKIKINNCEAPLYYVVAITWSLHIKKILFRTEIKIKVSDKSNSI